MKVEKSTTKFYNTGKVNKLRKYDHPIVQLHVKNKIDHIVKHIKFSKSDKVLEIGAGNGYFSYHLSKYCNLLVTDVNEAVLNLNPVNNKLVCNVNKLPFNDNSFDVVTCFDVLHHVEKIDEALKEMKRVTKKYIILVEPNADNILQKIFMIFSPKEWGTYKFKTTYLLGLLENNDLEIDQFDHIGRLITPNIKIPLWLLKKMPYSQSAQLNLSNIIICRK